MSDNPLIVMPPNPMNQAAESPERNLVIQANQLILNGQRAQAFNAVLQALSLNPNSTDALYLYAQLSPDRQQALEAAWRVLNAQPNHTEARLLYERLQSQPAAPSPAPGGDQQIMQQMLMQHHMLMQQQMLNQQQIAQQQMMMRQPPPMIPFQPVTVIDQTIFGVGFLLSCLIGLFGVSYMMNDQPVTGAIVLIVGFVWDGILIALLLSGIGAVLGIVLHLAFCYLTARAGSRVVQNVPMR
ncbi:MAG TPA: hypothetical protein VHP83_24610 [Aggregatilineaceae bacterium]|nr:hypothetical protein [Aggregatilineaceae bacterium]